jgi:hypothetical protein
MVSQNAADLKNWSTTSSIHEPRKIVKSGQIQDAARMGWAPVGAFD